MPLFSLPDCLLVELVRTSGLTPIELSRLMCASRDFKQLVKKVVAANRAWGKVRGLKLPILRPCVVEQYVLCGNGTTLNILEDLNTPFYPENDQEYTSYRDFYPPPPADGHFKQWPLSDRPLYQSLQIAQGILETGCYVQVSDGPNFEFGLTFKHLVFHMTPHTPFLKLWHALVDYVNHGIANPANYVPYDMIGLNWYDTVFDFHNEDAPEGYSCCNQDELTEVGYEIQMYDTPASLCLAGFADHLAGERRLVGGRTSRNAGPPSEKFEGNNVGVVQLSYLMGDDDDFPAANLEIIRGYPQVERLIEVTP